VAVRLSQAELRRLPEFLNEFCAPGTLDHLLPRVMEGLFRLIPCEGVSGGLVDPQTGEGSAQGYPADLFAPENTRQGISLGFPELRPRFQTLAQKVLTFSDLLSRSEFHRTAIYNAHYRRRSVEDVAVLPFMGVGGGASFFAIERRWNFSDRDSMLLEAAASPLKWAVSNASRLSQLEQENGVLQATLETSGWTGLVVSRQERICLESPTAGSLLWLYFGRTAGQALPDPVLGWMRAYARRPRETSKHSPQPASFSVARNGRRLIIRMLEHPAGYMLLFEEQDQETDWTRLMRLGLTPRQAQILAYIAMGKTNGEIAIILETSRRTVEKHVEQILARLGVETRTAAAAMALEWGLAAK
jgi:DNA-binding CsgD family transcriptional regulator